MQEKLAPRSSQAEIEARIAQNLARQKAGKAIKEAIATYLGTWEAKERHTPEHAESMMRKFLEEAEC